jgi:hypothetical protein
MATLARGQNSPVIFGIDKRRPFGPGKFINSKVPLQQAPSGSILSFPDPPVMFAAPLLALLLGAVQASAGSLVTPDESIGQPAMQTPQPALVKGAQLTPSGTMLAPHIAERQPAMPTPQPALMRGAQLSASGTVLAPAPRADAMVTPLSTLTRVVDKAVFPVIQAQPPQADTLPTPTATITRVPDVVRPPVTPLAAALRADTLPVPVPDLLDGARLNAAGPVLSPHLAFFQPAMPTPVATLWQGYTLAAAGSILAHVPRADFLPTPLSTLIVGFNPQPVRPLAAAPRADALPTPLPDLLDGAKLNAAGAVLAPHLSFFQPAMPTPLPTLWQGYTLASAGSILTPAPQADSLPTSLSTITRAPSITTPPTIQAQAPTADFLPTPQPVLFVGARLSAAGLILAQAPRADYLPTPLSTLIVGFNPSPVSPVAAALRADFLPTPQSVLLAGARLSAAGSVLAPHLAFFQPAMPTPQASLWQGYALATAGSILAQAPRADYLPTPLSTITRTPSVVLPPVIQSQAPVADFLPTPQPTLVAGARLAAAGTILAQAPRADFLPTPLSTLIIGFNPPPVIPLAAAPRADFLPTPQPLLLIGARLNASGSVVTPQLMFFQPAMPTPEPALRRGFTLTAAGTIVAQAPRADDLPTPLVRLLAAYNPVLVRPLAAAPRADDLPAPQSTLLTGARLTAAGSIVAPQFTHFQPAMPTPLAMLWRGYRLTAAGTILAQAPRADHLPTPLSTLIVGFNPLPVRPIAAAPRADALPTPLVSLSAGALVAAFGIIITPEVSTGQPKLPTPEPALWKGFPLKPAGTILTQAPHADRQIVASSTTLLAGSVVAVDGIFATPVAVFIPGVLLGQQLPPAGEIISPDPSVGQPMMPTPAVTLLTGYTLAPAGSMVRPPLTAELLDPGFAELLGHEPYVGPPPPPTPSGGGAPPFIPRQQGGGPSQGGGAGEVTWVSFRDRGITVTQIPDRGPDWVTPDGQQVYDINGPPDKQPEWWKQIVRESRTRQALVATRSADPFAGIRSATALIRVPASIDYARLARDLVEPLFAKQAAAVSFDKTALGAIVGAVLAADMRRQELDQAEAQLARQRAELEAEQAEWARWREESLGSTEQVVDEPEPVEVASVAPLALIRPSSKAMRWTVAVAFCAAVVTAVVWAWPKPVPAKRNRKRKRRRTGRRRRR